MGVLALHQRMAELWTIRKSRPLTAEEQRELDLCMDANVTLCWKMSKLENFSLMASMTKDQEWMHLLCAQIEQLQYGSTSNGRKKDGRK